MAFPTSIGPAKAYVASESVGEPVCVYGVGGSSEGLTVSLYFGKKGKLKGVLVYDGDKEEIVVVVSKVPKAAVA